MSEAKKQPPTRLAGMHCDECGILPVVSVVNTREDGNEFRYCIRCNKGNVESK